MLYCLSVCDATKRVILGDEPHGETLAVIEAETWREARRQVWRERAMDPYFYKAGWGWERRDNPN